MEQRRLNPLEPSRALLQKVLVEADQCPGIQHVSRRYPRLRDPLVDEELSQVPSVSAIRLGSTLRASQRRRLSRLRDMSLDAGACQLLHDVTPTRAALQSEHDTRAALEALQPDTKVATIGWRDPARLDPTRDEIHIVERQLSPVNVQATQHGHGHLPIALDHAGWRAHMPSW